MDNLNNTIVMGNIFLFYYSIYWIFLRVFLRQTLTAAKIN